jgi:hypothetical protein
MLARKVRSRTRTQTPRPGRTTTNLSVGPASMSALLALVRDSPVLLWDPDGRVLIAATLVGDWLPLDWSGRRPDPAD